MFTQSQAFRGGLRGGCGRRFVGGISKELKRIVLRAMNLFPAVSINGTRSFVLNQSFAHYEGF